MDGYPVASSKLTDKKTMVSWKIFVGNVIINFKNDGFDFSLISQKNTTILCNKMDLTYDFYMKHHMCALEWQLNKFFNKNKKLITKIPRTWIHPISRKFESYRDLLCIFFKL